MNQKNNEQLTEPIAKKPPYGNPLVSHKFGADPYALVYNDRVYLYATNDEFEYDEEGNITENKYGNINTLTVISSADLVNWTDHGVIKVAGPNGAAKWAVNSWAPAIAHKVIDGKDKFFIYFANNGSNIGVVTSDSPLGPWVDPINKPIISRDLPGVQGVPWLFDPAVLVDDDGTGYLYFGGGVPEGEFEMPNTARSMQLGDDMISVVGEAKPIPAPFMFESGGINKRDGLYYYSYCSNFFTGERPEGAPAAGEIAYLISENPMGPWTYQKSFLKNPGHFFDVSGNNHHAMFKFKDTWYIAYHAQTVSAAMGVSNGYRSTHLNEVIFGENGVIEDIKADMQGVKKVKDFNPYETVSAVTMAWQAGINVKELENTDASQPNLVLTDIENGDWIGIASADFSDGASEVIVKVASDANDGSIEVRIDSLDGDIISTIDVPNTGGLDNWDHVSASVSEIEGVHDIYFVFRGVNDQTLFQLASWSFKK
ncbi:glycoside hydrolase family 43 protein [Amphibacillus indicireducens]|uniref:CBM6 domain-containing protein n=1 Tax=Amphibacillus indicireducens TaxID=1076330 RepID=A0ABP7VMH5_9BACI